jgi:hypothetical protein
MLGITTHVYSKIETNVHNGDKDDDYDNDDVDDDAYLERNDINNVANSII